MRSMALFVTLLAVAFPAALTAAEETAAKKQYQKLLSEYQTEGGSRIFAKRFLKFAETHSKDPAAVDALSWVVEKVRGKTDTAKALNQLRKHYVTSPRIGAACKAVANSRSVGAEGLLRAIEERHPDKQVRGQANFYLAALLELETNLVSQLNEKPDLAARVLQYYGKEYGAHLASLKSASLAAKREGVYERMQAAYRDVELDGNRLGEVAKKMLFRIHHLEVGRIAPDIQGEDIQGKRFKLSDYRGKIVMLTFWGHW